MEVFLVPCSLGRKGQSSCSLMFIYMYSCAMHQFCNFYLFKLNNVTQIVQDIVVYVKLLYLVAPSLYYILTTRSVTAEIDSTVTCCCYMMVLSFCPCLGNVSGKTSFVDLSVGSVSLLKKCGISFFSQHHFHIVRFNGRKVSRPLFLPTTIHFQFFARSFLSFCQYPVLG